MRVDCIRIKQGYQDISLCSDLAKVLLILEFQRNNRQWTKVLLKTKIKNYLTQKLCVFDPYLIWLYKKKQMVSELKPFLLVLLKHGQGLYFTILNAMF